MPLDQALAAVAEQADDARTAKVFTGAAHAGCRGRDARRRAGALAADVFRALSRTRRRRCARPAGFPTCSRASPIISRRARSLRQKFTLALIYPALVTAIALAVIAVLLAYVVPQVVSVYQQSRQTLPWLTQALIAMSGFFRATGWYWLAGIVVAIAAFAVANRRAAFRARWHASLLRMPVAGRLVAAIDTARFASTLAILTASGAPLLRALDAARDVVWSLPLRAAADASARLVREGVSLARALKEQKVFPPVLIHLVANGEASGQLAPMLERAATLLEQESERRITWFAALVQPALIVAMGAIVLVLVLAIMLPIVSMNQLIR